MRFWSRIVLAALCTLAVSPAAAQEITASLTGTVTDETGAVLPGVTVTVRNTGTGFTKDVVTSGEGAYTAPLLPTGRYEVTFALSGFQTATATNLNLHVNDRVLLDMKLKTGGVTETVEVNAAAQMIQPMAAVQSLMGATQVQELPLNNRNFVQLATLVPGVTSSLADEVGVGLTSNVSISVNGQRRNAVNWLVDGASNVDVGSNITLLNTPTLESIEEFKIITSSYAAEWPRSGGGIINVVTKSGTNDFRVSAYEFYRNDSLNANSFIRKQTGCSADAAGAVTCLDRSANGATDFAAIRNNPPKLDYNNFGFTVGGPIKKDKLFFFYSQEWRKISRAPTDRTAIVPEASWLTDPSNANYVAPADRDPNAVRLLALWPAANVGTNLFLDPQPNEQDTRQEVVRVDYLISPKWRLMGRYTHDLSATTEPGGLFFNTAIPNVATTLTDVPGQVFVGQLTTTVNPTTFNELSLQFSSNAIKSEYGDNVRNTRSDLGLTIAEIFPENREGLIPFMVFPGGIASIGANQLFDNKYRNFTVADNVTLARGAHQFKGGIFFAFEQKDELSTSGTQGTFNWRAGGGRTAFQNFLTGNRDGLCGSNCDYVEPATEIASQFRWNRYEFYLQDTWSVTPRLRFDLGLRYSLQPGFTDENDLLTNFVPGRFSAANAPPFADAAGGQLLIGTGDALNGIVVAGQNSPYGRAVNNTDKNNFQPRLGFSWDATGDGETLLRGGYGIYYDQPVMGVFLQNAFVNPPVNANPTVLNPQLSNPGSGSSPTTRPPAGLIATSDPFDIPRTQQWNVGVQRQLYRRGMIDIGYAGSKGDNLIQPVDINQPQPADVVAANGAVNRARPFPGYAGINFRQTTAHNMYHGLLMSFRHDAGRAGLLNISYTLSRSKTSATNDRDAIDVPQNPRDLEAEYALSRTDRTHVFTANYVYELPFFKNAGGIAKFALGGWQVSGITQLWSGPPISRVVNGTTNGSRRGIRVDQVGDPVRQPAPRHPGRHLLVQPRRVRASRRRAVREHRPRDLPPARREPVGHHAVQELLPEHEDAAAVPGRLHQRVQPHAMGPDPHPEHVQRGGDGDELRGLDGELRPHHRHARPAGGPAGPALHLELGRTLTAVAIVAAAVVRAGAQETTGAITGRVTDGTGAPLPAATVRVTRAADGFAREVATARSGTFVAALLPPGTYDLTVAGDGFARATVRGIVLHAGDRLVVDAVLGAAESDRRWGSGERAVQLTPALQYVVTARQIEALPLINRHVAALVAVTPGVTSALADEPSVAHFSGEGVVFGGGQSVSPDWFLDGMTVGAGGLLLTPSLESVEEVRVVAGTPAVTWPRGAAVALVTRSGTNAWRAGAYELHRDGGLDANSFFRNLSLDPTVRAEPAEVRADIFGYSAGGPIRKDALFVFWSQEWRRRRGDAEADVLDGRQETARVDHRATAQWRLMGRYTHDVIGQGDERPRTVHVGVAQATAALSTTTVNELSYRMRVAEFLTSHALADNLSFQRGDHSLALGGFVARAAGFTRYEAYAQDSWRAHRALTLDFGVRRAGGDWGPGIGAAWRASSGTTIRAGLSAPQAVTPTRRWSLGFARRLYSRGAFDAAYLGARAEAEGHLPELRYDGLLGHFRHEGPAGLLDLAYTISRDRVREGIDWERASGDRRHVFTATWARDLRGFTIAGITTFQSGPPARAITRAGRNDVFARQVADPFVNLPSDRYYFSPAAFAPDAVGAPGSPLSPFSLPGRNQWDVAVSRAWRVGAGARLRLRADVFNLFNHTQFTGVDTFCDAGPADTTCAVPNTTLGQYTSARAPRQVQLGIRLDWN